jgi:SAM-dependent methyltransferase
MRKNPAVLDIDRMPRGGPDASWVDRRLQTDRLEYLDRGDVDDRVKRQVVRSLERLGSVFKDHEKFARLALDEVADIADPMILELGSGHGGLSRKLLEIHPGAQVTVTDIDSTSVAYIAAGDLGRHPRATVRAMDATEIDAADGEFDLVVFAQSFHHLPPPLASRVFAEGTRVADTAHHRPAAAAVDPTYRTAGGVPAADGRPPICPRSRHQLAAGLQSLGDAGTGPIRRPDHPAATSQAAAVGPPDRCRQPPRLAASSQLPVAH